MSAGCKISSWERNLPIDAYLKYGTELVYVVQCTLSPGSKEHPTWTSLYWHYLPKAAQVHKTVARHGDCPSFDNLSDARACCEAIIRSGEHRARVIVRSTSIHEALVP